MRWKRKVNTTKIGDIKERVKYLFCPLCLDDDCRWLEFAKIRYVYKKIEDYSIENINCHA